MVIDMGYWAKVFRRLLIFIATLLGIYLAYKLAAFYMPFLIAFLISVIIEPLIRKLTKRSNIGRKKSAIIVLIIVSLIIIGLLIWGIITLISEASNLLESLNIYFENAYLKIQDIVANINFDKIKVSGQVSNVIESSAHEFLAFITEKAKHFLSTLLQSITSLPSIGIYVGITLIATYFICTDRLYILDQIEHHFPKTWVKRFMIHIKNILSALGSYLRAESILVLITFVQVLIGLFLMQVFGLNVKYPVIAALVIGFVDALPILGSRYSNCSLGCYFCN